MKIGITLPHLGSNAAKDNILKIALAAEKEGLDSVWVAERLLWPLKPQTPYRVTPDGSLPTFYQNVLDPLETLAYVAANTNKIALGTSVIDMLFHNPVILARQFATLDVLSEGRAICGLGIGWSKDEYQVSNVPFEHKGERTDEFIQILNKIWTDDVVEFKGKYYNIPESKIGPKPIQKPHMPIYLGGFVPATFRRIAKYADGWLPSMGGPLDFIENGIKSLKAQAIKENRNPDQIKTVILTFPQVSEAKSNSGIVGGGAGQQQHHQQPQRFPMIGSIEEIGNDIQRIKDMGVKHIVFAFVGLKSDMVIDTAKQLGKFAR
jgi:probable F420-dependent oxidoreductase